MYLQCIKRLSVAELGRRQENSQRYRVSSAVSDMLKGVAVAVWECVYRHEVPLVFSLIFSISPQ